MPLTVIGYVPAGVDVVVEIVIVLVHVGRHWEGAKDTLAPEGSPVALNVTAVDCPDTRVAVTVAVTEPPAITVPDVGFTARLKSNSGGAVSGSHDEGARPPPIALTAMGYGPAGVARGGRGGLERGPGPDHGP